jgi:hypothetical protein
LIVAFLVLDLVILVAMRWFARNKPVEPALAEPAPQIEVRRHLPIPQFLALALRKPIR